MLIPSHITFYLQMWEKLCAWTHHTCVDNQQTSYWGNVRRQIFKCLWTNDWSYSFWIKKTVEIHMHLACTRTQTHTQNIWYYLFWYGIGDVQVYIHIYFLKFVTVIVFLYKTVLTYYQIVFVYIQIYYLLWRNAHKILLDEATFFMKEWKNIISN